jgi:hypothetical protein
MMIKIRSHPCVHAIEIDMLTKSHNNIRTNVFYIELLFWGQRGEGDGGVFLMGHNPRHLFRNSLRDNALHSPPTSLTLPPPD